MLLNDEVKSLVKTELTKLVNPVKLIVITQEIECNLCRDNVALVREISELSDKINLVVYNFVLDEKQVSEFKIDKIPALAIVGEKDYGIRFYGIPAGYEFTTFMDTIKMVSLNDSGLSSPTRLKLAVFTKPVDIKIFVTLTCPYCPLAVKLANQFAIESSLINAQMIEVTEFPHLANRYSVLSVPKLVINETIQIEGALSEDQLLNQLIQTQNIPG